MNHWKAITGIGIMKIQQSGAQNPTIFRLSNAKHWVVQVEFYRDKQGEEVVATTVGTWCFSTKYLTMWFTTYNCA